MKIERTDPMLAARELSHLKKKDDSAEVQGSEMPKDEIQLQAQAPYQRSLEPGNVPLPLRAGQGEMRTDEAGAPPVTVASYGSDDMQPLGSYPSITNLNTGGTPGDLSFEVIQYLTDNCRKWTTVNFVFDGREGPKL